MMRWLKAVRWRRQLRHDPLTRPSGGTFVLDATWDRTEELRPDRLGPTQEDVQPLQDLERPSRTLGKLPPF
jgi:hypothetical protein